MRTSILAGSVLAALSLTVPLSAQSIAADVILHSGPIAGHISINDGYPTYYHRPVRRVVVVERVAPRVIVVERFHGRGHGRGHGHGKHWKRHGYRPVTVYYVDGRYYDRYDRHHPRVRRIVVYERSGRYYRDWDDHHDRWDDDRRDDRPDDRRHDRDDRWDDDRDDHDRDRYRRR